MIFETRTKCALRQVGRIEWFEAYVGSATIYMTARWSPWPVSLFVSVVVAWFIVRAAVARLNGDH